MERPRTFSKIVLALHMPESEVKRFLNWLGLSLDDVPRYETDWKHVARPDENQLLIFGRRGLRRVKADKLVEQLIHADYRYRSCVLCLKPDTYTKTEARAAHRAGQAHIKEGDPQLDEHKQPSWKFCLEVNFERAPLRPVGSHAPLLIAFLKPLVWQRSRVFAHWEADESRVSVVELVKPKRSQPSSLTELHFKPPGMFVKRSVSPP